MSKLFSRIENGVAGFFLVGMVVLAVGEVIARQLFGSSLPGATVYVQQFNLVLAFAGAIIAARSKRHLALSFVHALEHTKVWPYLQIVSALIITIIMTALTHGTWELIQVEMDSRTVLEFDVPAWWFEALMIPGFALVGLRLVSARAQRWWQFIPVVLLGFLAVYGLSTLEWDNRDWLTWPGAAVLLIGAAFGTPIFVIMGGFACLLFFIVDIPLSAVPVEAHQIIASPTLPVIPLFTLAGYLLASGGSSKRLIRLFTAAFGWFPGGIATATILVSAFFTTFTGASGVTILGLGGLLLPILVAAGYSQAFALGLITCAGSLGMLFPPSLPVILYGVTAGISIKALFLGGILPGILLIAMVVAYGVFIGMKQEKARPAFDLKELLLAIKGSVAELFLPLLVLGGIFAGVLTLTEAAAVAAAYVFVVEVVIRRSIGIRKDLPGVLVESATVVGGLMMIFGTALGLTNYLVDAEIPMRLAAWTQENVESRWVFILAINFFLLIAGSLMEGLSAIVILVPLVAPIGASFEFDPVHLGILFLANLEVGFLLPPVGLNLFLSSIRFQVPLTSLYKPILPFLAITGVGVLIISYVPWLSTWLPSLLGE